jgi:hypothetical protein
MDARYTPIEPFSVWAHLRVDAVVWGEALASLDRAKQSASGDDLRRAVEGAMRAAAVDAGPPEGGYDVECGVVALQATAWQAAMRETTVSELFGARLRACHLARDAAINRLPITEMWLRRLHEEICGPQRSVRILFPQGWQDAVLLHGAYKRLPNRGCQADGVPCAFAPVAETPPEMRRLVEELGSSHFACAHPVLQAAYAHFGLARIHPFQDGNGRVARALASVYVYRAISLPLLIYAADRASYLASIHSANSGNRAVLVDFLFQRAVDVMRLITRHLTAEGQPRARRGECTMSPWSSSPLEWPERVPSVSTSCCPGRG